VSTKIAEPIAADTLPLRAEFCISHNDKAEQAGKLFAFPSSTTPKSAPSIVTVIDTTS
jgi:hypothetical protein